LSAAVADRDDEGGDDFGDDFMTLSDMYNMMTLSHMYRMTTVKVTVIMNT